LVRSSSSPNCSNGATAEVLQLLGGLNSTVSAVHQLVSYEQQIEGETNSVQKVVFLIGSLPPPGIGLKLLSQNVQALQVEVRDVANLLDEALRQQQQLLMTGGLAEHSNDYACQ
jgi:hypothetical protein